MNIFVVDKDPALAAKMLSDRHVNKMILERRTDVISCSKTIWASYFI